MSTLWSLKSQITEVLHVHSLLFKTWNKSSPFPGVVSSAILFYCLVNLCEYISSLQQQDQNIFQLGNHAHFITALSFSCSTGIRALAAIYISSYH